MDKYIPETLGGFIIAFLLGFSLFVSGGILLTSDNEMTPIVFIITGSILALIGGTGFLVFAKLYCDRGSGYNQEPDSS